MTTPPSLDSLADDAVLRRRLTALARRWLAHDSEAEDLVQEAYLRTFAVPIPPDGAGRQAWMTTILHHLSIDCLRRRKRYRAILEDQAGGDLPRPRDDWPERLVEQAQSVDAAVNHLAALFSAEEVAVVLLHQVFDLSHAELGPLTGRSEAASRQHLHRLLLRLRAEREARHQPPSDRDADDARLVLVALCRQAMIQRDHQVLISLLQGSRPRAVAMASGPDIREGPSVQPESPWMAIRALLALAGFMEGDGEFLAWLPLEVADLELAERVAS